MQKHELKLGLDWILALAGTATFSTGLVLLLRFHAGQGAFATSAWGIGRLVWLNVHRLSAALLVAGVMTHVGLHWRTFRNRLAKLVTRGARRPINSELLMYTGFSIAALTGLVAWLALEGSSPLLGPAVIGRASTTRHPWIDTHHVSSLVSLVLVAHHIGHRRRFLARRPRPIKQKQ